MARNRHDLLFRKTFNDVKMFREFCIIHLPEDLKRKIDLSKLKLRKLSGNFIRTQIILKYGEKVLKDKKKYEELKEEIADVIYSAEFVTGGEVLLIFHAEHQSRPDKLYPLRNALYDISAVKDYVEQYKPEKLPVPISLLYYHGRPTPYPHTTDIMDMFTDRDVAEERFLKPYLVDLGQFTDDELLAHGEIGGFEISYKHTYDKKVPQERVVKLVEALKNCSDVELRQAWYTYTIETWEAEKKPMLDIYSEIIPDDRRFLMTVAEQLITEGRQEGRQEGVHIGEDKKAREMALGMLKAGDTVSKVANISQLSLTEVREIKASITH